MGYLDKVPDDKVFVLGTKKLFTIDDLFAELNSISDEEYSHYASANHNYFADWIMHVVKYDKLAADLINTNGNKKDAVKVLEKHIKKLQSNSESKKEIKIKNPPFIKKDPVKQTAETDLIIEEVLKQPEKVEKLYVKDINPEEKIIEEEKEITKEVSEAEQPKTEHSIHEIESILEKLSKEDVEIRNVIWKHFKWEMAKEFMYGMAIGMIMGLILSKLFMP